MNDNQKIQLKRDVLSKLVKETFDNHRNLAKEIGSLYEKDKVSKLVSESTVYRMLTNEDAQFKARDVRVVAEALGCSFESLTDIKKPGFRTVELVKQSSGQNVHEEVVKADILDFHLFNEPEDEQAQAGILDLVKRIEHIHKERGSRLSTISFQLDDKFEIKKILDRGAEHFSIFIGVGQQLLSFENTIDGYFHRAIKSPHAWQKPTRRVFNRENIYQSGSTKGKDFKSNRITADFAKVLLIRSVKPETAVLSEQLPIDPHHNSFDCHFNRAQFVKVENIARELRFGVNFEPIKDLVEFESLKLEEISNPNIRTAEERRRSEDVDKLK